jgi:hypothetical protein
MAVGARAVANDLRLARSPSAITDQHELRPGSRAPSGPTATQQPRQNPRNMTTRRPEPMSDPARILRSGHRNSSVAMTPAVLSVTRGAPSRIRTCTHGSGGRVAELAKMGYLPAGYRPLLATSLKPIPRMFRIMVGLPGSGPDRGPSPVRQNRRDAGPLALLLRSCGSRGRRLLRPAGRSGARRRGLGGLDVVACAADLLGEPPVLGPCCVKVGLGSLGPDA